MVENIFDGYGDGHGEKKYRPAVTVTVKFFFPAVTVTVNIFFSAGDGGGDGDKKSRFHGDCHRPR